MDTKSHRFQRDRSLVGAFDAKTHFSQLLERVAKGEEITITRHDRPIARLVPVGRPSREHLESVFDRMAALRQSLGKPRDKASLKDLINEGRRF